MESRYRYRSLLALLLAAVTLGAPRLSAQSTAATAIGLGGVDQLFRRIESVNIYYGGSIGSKPGTTATGARLPWSKDYGLEFLLHIGEFGRFTRAHEQRVAAVERRRAHSLDSLRLVRAERLRMPSAQAGGVRDSLVRRFAMDSARIVAEPEMPFTATSITVKKHVSIVGKDTLLVGVDSEFVGKREPPPADERMVDFDVGVGYGQMDGLRSSGAYELHGSVRELPSVSAYATLKLTPRVGVYAGVRTGVITLQDAQLFVASDAGVSTFTLSSTSFEFGVPLGLDVQPVMGIHLTFEAAYMRRIFNSLSFDPTSGFPAGYPRSLDLSGLSWSAGVQFPLP